MTFPLPAMELRRHEAPEPFRMGEMALPFSLGDFWSWAASDLASNALRGSLAEYLVARALGIELTVRAEWAAYDLQVPGGPSLEVKSSTYLQTWPQREPSRPCFGIKPTVAWSPEAGTYAPSEQRRRQADLYVFALLHHLDKVTLDPMDVTQWTFHVLPRHVLDASVGTQATISLPALLCLEPTVCDFAGLPVAVASLAAELR